MIVSIASTTRSLKAQLWQRCWLWCYYVRDMVMLCSLLGFKFNTCCNVSNAAACDYLLSKANDHKQYTAAQQTTITKPRLSSELMADDARSQGSLCMQGDVYHLLFDLGVCIVHVPRSHSGQQHDAGMHFHFCPHSCIMYLQSWVDSQSGRFAHAIRGICSSKD